MGVGEVRDERGSLGDAEGDLGSFGWFKVALRGYNEALRV
jgi:hypothetical protein